MAKINGEAPRAGTGLHSWLLDRTRILCASDDDREAVFQQVLQEAKDSNRPEQHLIGEIKIAIDGAANWYLDHPLAKARVAGRRQQPKQHLLLEQIIDRRRYRGGVRRPPPVSTWKEQVDERLVALTLRRRSPSYFCAYKGKDPLPLLYAGLNVPLWMHHDQRNTRIRPLEEWRQISAKLIQFIAPNPFVKCGNQRTKENAAERMWAVVEFDRGTLEEQAKKLDWLDEVSLWLRLAMVVFSGNKSLHGWFTCYGLGATKLRDFYRIATRIGADGALASNVQITRRPGGFNRKTRRKQEILHFSETEINQQGEKINERRLV
jgi:hypothetical protein